MKKKIIYIIIESVKRELDSKILLSLKALKKNYRVVIGQKGYLREFVKDTNAGIMIMKSIGKLNTEHIQFIKQKNFKIVASDEELVIAMDFEDKMKWRMPPDNFNRVDLMLAVGEESDYPFYKKNFFSRIDNVHLCGNLRLELLKKKYRKVFDINTKEYQKKFGKYFLLSTSFPRINRLRKKTEIDFVFNRIVDHNVDPESHHVKIENQLIIIQRSILLKTLKFLDNFEKNFPGKSLVISPHPNENINFWINYVNKRNFKKIFVNTDVHSSSSSLINGCEILISSNSTTLLEAHFLDKKKINFLGEDESISEIKILKKVSEVVRSLDDLNNYLKTNTKNENTNSTIEKSNTKLGEIRNFDDNFDSFESILEKFDKFDDVDSHNSLFKNYYKSFLSKYRMLKYELKIIFKKVLKKDDWMVLKHARKIGNKLDTNIFINNIKNINRIENVQNLKIKKISTKLFLLDTVD